MIVNLKSRLARWSLLIATILVAAATVPIATTRATAAATAPSTLPAGTIGKLKGKVADEAGKPLAGAFVRLYGLAGEFEQQYRLVEETTSGEDGSFELSSLAGADMLTRTKTNTLVVSCKGHGTCTAGLDSIMYTPLRLGKGYKQRGSVKDPQGRPLARALVYACFDLSHRGIHPEIKGLSTVTDAQGEFTLDDLPVWYVRQVGFYAQAEGYAVGFMKSSPDSGPMLAPDKPLQFVLRPEAKIQGVVIDTDSNQPITGIDIRCNPHSSVTCYQYARSDKDGKFEFGNLPAGDYALEMLPPPENDHGYFGPGFGLPQGKFCKITTREGETVSDVRFDVKKGILVKVQFQSADSGAPLKQAVATFMTKDYNKPTAGGFSKIVRGDANGEGSLWLLGADYTAICIAPGHRGIHRKSLAVTVAPGQKAPLVLKVRPTPVLHAKLVDEAGKPVAGATVDPLIIGGTAMTAAPVSDEKGNFSLEVVQTRSFLMHLFQEKLRLACIAQVNVDDLDKEQGFTLRPTLTIKGFVQDDSGKAIPDATIYCWPTGGRSDQQGRFEIPMVQQAKGKDAIPATIRSPMHIDNTVPIDPAKAKDGLLDLGKVELISLDKTISGTVMDKQGDAIFGANLVVRWKVGKQDIWAHVVSDQQGRFKLEHLPAEKGEISCEFYGKWGDLVGSAMARGGDQDVKIVVGEKSASTQPASSQASSHAASDVHLAQRDTKLSDEELANLERLIHDARENANARFKGKKS